MKTTHKIILSGIIFASVTGIVFFKSKDQQSTTVTPPLQNKEQASKRAGNSGANTVANSNSSTDSIQPTSNSSSISTSSSTSAGTTPEATPHLPTVKMPEHNQNQAAENPAVKNQNAPLTSNTKMAHALDAKNVTQIKSDSAITKEAPQKPQGYPGISQKTEDLMVSDVRVTSGEGVDQIAVVLTSSVQSKTFTGKIWVIGEYVQRGTTGAMYMPSHQELKLSPEGQPANTQAGLSYEVKTSSEKKFSITKPGFDGEELVGLKIGLTDASGTTHIAKVSTQHIAKKKPVKRAKVQSP